MTPEPEQPVSNEEKQIRNFNEKKTPEILKPLWSNDGKDSVFCVCGHHVECHKTGRVPLCDFEIPDSSIKGRHECQCTKFKPQ